MLLTPISIGKYRRIQQCSTALHTFSILALDHRNNLRAALNPQYPESITDEDLVQFKRLVVEAVTPAASAVLLDPEFGIAQSIVSGALPGCAGVIVALEATGYTGDPQARQSSLLPDWNAEKALRLGANAVKLLVYYHPEADTAGEIETFVGQVAEECRQCELPLFLEALSYPLDPQLKQLPSEEKRRVVIETARRLVLPGVDVLKAEFPLNITADTDENEWMMACTELSNACKVPWVLLSASVDYETYLHQVEVACRAGASGVAAGRAVWKEATKVNGAPRPAFLYGTAYDRMQRLTGLCNALARPWTEFYKPVNIDTGWYLKY